MAECESEDWSNDDLDEDFADSQLNTAPAETASPSPGPDEAMTRKAKKSSKDKKMEKKRKEEERLAAKRREKEEKEQQRQHEKEEKERQKQLEKERIERNKLIAKQRKLFKVRRLAATPYGSIGVCLRRTGPLNMKLNMFVFQRCTSSPPCYRSGHLRPMASKPYSF